MKGRVEMSDKIMLADGFEEAFIGIGQQFSRHYAVYDRDICIKVLMKDGMSEDEAEEYFEFNVTGAWVGHGTPIFVRSMTLEDAEPTFDELQQ
jgi:hypothetical protein